MSPSNELVDQLLDVLSTGGADEVWPVLTAELRTLLEPIPIEQRYMIGLQWLDAVDRQLQSAGVQLPALTFLRVLVGAGGSELDQTVFLPTGIQCIPLN